MPPNAHNARCRLFSLYGIIGNHKSASYVLTTSTFPPNRAFDTATVRLSAREGAFVKYSMTAAVGLLLLTGSAAIAQYNPRDSQNQGQYQDQRQNDARRGDSQQRSGPRYEDGFRDGYRA